MKLSILLKLSSLLLPAKSGAAPATRKLGRNSTTTGLTTTNLWHSSAISVNITDPRAGSTFALPTGSNALDLPVRGTASVVRGVSDGVAYIYVIDSSSRTSEPDLSCGTVLQCIQEFFRTLHEEALVEGSAEAAAVIEFGGDATVTAGLQDPNYLAIRDAFGSLKPSGESDCGGALDLAAMLVRDASNASYATVVIFAGTGDCNDESANVSAAAGRLGATGAIVHSVSISKSADCHPSSDFSLIPRNGGTCHSLPDLHNRTRIIESLLIGTAAMVRLEMRVDGSNYTVLNNEIDLPVKFNTSLSVNGLALGEGFHRICVRAVSSYSLGGRKPDEDCCDVSVVATATPAATEPPTPPTSPSAPTIATLITPPAPTTWPAPPVATIIKPDAWSKIDLPAGPAITTSVPPIAPSVSTSDAPAGGTPSTAGTAHYQRPERPCTEERSWEGWEIVLLIATVSLAGVFVAFAAMRMTVFVRNRVDRKEQKSPDYPDVEEDTLNMEII